jgi:hypothetical protein
MTMTAERIRMINAAYGGDIRVEVSDLEDAAGRPRGYACRYAIQDVR